MELKSPYGLRYIPPRKPFSHLRLRIKARRNARVFADAQHYLRIILDELAQYIEVDSSLEADRRFYEIFYALVAFVTDINLTVVSLSRTRVPSERHLLLRMACLHLYEVSKPLSEFNRRSRQLIELRSDDPELLRDCGEFVRQLNRFSEQNKRYLKAIRHLAIGHRGVDFQAFISAAESVEDIKILRLLAEFLSISTPLSSLLTRCAAASQRYFESKSLQLAVGRAQRILAQ